MIRKLILLIYLLFNTYIIAQNSISGKVLDHHSGEPILGVNVIFLDTNIGTATDDEGAFFLTNIPEGKYILRFSHISYDEYEVQITIPFTGENLVIELDSESEELEEVYVNATRSSRTIENEPTRVEVIAGEEIEEKINMDPSNISMVLNESTGIQVQQTSAASANSTFRIQGFDGRYTQLLKDGFPLFAGFSGSLSIMQVPPLDLSQIEIIKGSSSTLYGGGAIAGLVNLISKQPGEKRELSFLINGTSALGLDLSAYYSRRNDKYGFKVLASRNTQKVYDNNDDNFSDLPQVERYSLNPDFYFYFGEKSTLRVGGIFSFEERIGGHVDAVGGNNNSNNFYAEKNNSGRFASQVQYTYSGVNNSFTFKNSISVFNRKLSLQNYTFEGKQFSTFTEAVYKIIKGNYDWLFGVNLYTEDFNDESDVILNRSYTDITYGAFVNNIFDINKTLSLESGLRFDYNNDFGFLPLPRINLLIKWNENLSSRIGGGFGYKIPTIFTEKSDELSFRNIIPVNTKNTEAEKSLGFNLDLNYNTIIFDEFTFSVNNLFFYTRINNPLFLNFNNSNNYYEFLSYDGYFDTKGLETNLKLTYGHYKLFAGYTFTDVKRHSGGVTSGFPLTPKHKLGLVLMYEVHGNLRIGVEAYYTGKQSLEDGTATTDYWMNGLMIEKRFGNFSLFINFENFLDTRQSKFGPMYSGSFESPNFAELYAPTDGRIINGGIKINL